MPLRLRLALLFAVATAVVIAGAGVVFVLQMRVSVEASLDPGLRSKVAAVGDELGTEGAPVLAAGGDTIVQISTPEGRMIASSPGAGPLLDPAQ
ncbi:MAG: hypothetical protein L0I76_37275, partial [Pseudonocardia sp.]|nr:hypothetical protein [Pseudonocardia sp.]